MKKILYVAPDISIPHTGDFVGGSTHVLKVAESLAKRGNKVFKISRKHPSGANQLLAMAKPWVVPIR